MSAPGSSAKLTEAGKGRNGDTGMSNGKGSHDPFETSEERDLKRKMPSHFHDCKFYPGVTQADVQASTLMDIRKAKDMRGNKGTGKSKDKDDDKGTGMANDQDDQTTGKAQDQDDDTGTCKAKGKDDQGTGKAKDKDGTGTGKAKGKDDPGTSSQGGKGWLRHDEIMAMYPQEDYSMACFPQRALPGMPTQYLIQPRPEQ